MTKNKAALTSALALCAAGFALLPLKGKAPFTRLLPQGEDGTPSTAELAKNPATAQTITAWFAAVRDLNIGVFTGVGRCPPLVVDLDPAKCPDPDRRAVLEARRELAPGVYLPPTPVHVRSGSGGRHLYYAHPPEQVRTVTRNGHRAGSHVDLQAETRYVVVPPSIHPDTGEAYLWVDDDDRVLSIDQVIERLAGLPDAPHWTIRAPADDRENPEAPRIQSGAWITEAWTLTIPEGGILGGTGGRKQTLRSLAQYYAQHEYPLDATIAMLTTWSETRCRPPLASREVSSITNHIFAKVAEELAISVSDRVSLRSRGPRFPHDLFLGTKFGRYCRAMSARVNSDLVAVASLAALGAASTGGYNLHYLEPGIELSDSHWIAPSALWIMPIAESGVRKSVITRGIRPVVEGTQDVLARFACAFNAELADLREDLELEKKELRKLEDRDEARRLRQEITQRLVDLPKELGERWILSDVTPESFLDDLSRTGYLALISEEGHETISKFFGHYSGSADMNGVLKAWDGGVTYQSRISRGYSEIRGLCSMLTLVQPSTLRALSTVDAEERGLMARFLFCVIHDAEEFEPLSKADSAQYCAEFEDAIRAIFYGGTDAAGSAEQRAKDYRPEYQRDPALLGASSFALPGDARLIRPDLRGLTDVVFRGECVAALKELEDELRDAAGEGGEHYLARAWARKAHEHAMRIAAVLQLSESPPLDHETVTMDLAWVTRAIALVKHYFLPHYYCAKDLIDQPPQADLGLHILAHFGGRDSFTLGEAAAFVHKRTPDVRPVIEWLERVGAVTIKQAGRSLIVYPIPCVEY